MKTIHLNLTSKWYDMIHSGEKREEYRELSQYWIVRLSNAIKRGATTVTFSNGMHKNRRQMVIEKKGIAIGKGKEKWGAAPGKVYFKIQLGEKIGNPPVVRSLHNLQYVPFSRHDQYGSTYKCKKCGKEFQERHAWGKWRDLHNGEIPELGECR